MVFNQPDSTFLASSQLSTSIDNAIVLSLFMLSFFFVIVCGLLKWKQIYVGFLSFVFIGIAIGDPVIKREWVWSHEQV